MSRGHHARKISLTMRKSHHCLKQCNVCGTSISIPRPESRTRSSFQSVRARQKAKASRENFSESDKAVGAVNNPPTANVMPSARDLPQGSTSNPSRPQHLAMGQTMSESSTNRKNKHKRGLQGMLQRNREREVREAQQATHSRGLASFLQGL